MTLWGQDVSTYLKQAETQFTAGQYREAMSSYQRAISQDPANSKAYEKLGDVYGKLGMPSEAATAYEKAAELLLAKPAPRQEQSRPNATQTTAQNANRPAATPAPPKGTSGGGRPDGLYFMTRFWPGSGLETATYMFHSGTVIKNPIGSTLQDMNLSGERATHPNDVGTYSLQSGNLTLTFHDGSHPAKFEPETKGCFGWDAGVFCPVEVFKPGTTLDGTFSGGASVSGGAVMASSGITFKPDGTYASESAGSFSSKGTRTDVSGGSTRSERGRYRIDGTALHMMPEGGKEIVVSTFPYDDDSTGPPPRSVYFGGVMLKRTK